MSILVRHIGYQDDENELKEEEAHGNGSRVGGGDDRL